MRLEVRIDGPPRRWHQDFAGRLRGAGASVHLRRRTHLDERELRNRDRVVDLERWLDRLLSRQPSVGLTRAGLWMSEDTGGEVDAVLDLGSDPGFDGTWRVTFDGTPGEAGLLTALRSGRFPLVEIYDPQGSPTAAARPGSEFPGSLLQSYADVLAGTATLVVGALAGKGFASPARDSASASPTRRRRSSAETVARRVVGSVAHSGYRALYRAPHWRVGWRYVADGQADVIDLLAHPTSGWRDLPDDGLHFYADPFPFVGDGRTWLFVEDFDHRIGRGVVSVVEFDRNGPVGTPEPVLISETHLSYPFVFAHDGEVWMIPETCEAGTIELFRARRFPDVWVREKTLLTGIEASDTTLFRHGERWWMFATVRHGGSYSDTLHIWTADDLAAQWRPHRANPVLVDIASARPGGRMVLRNGRIFRPVQDNRSGYGAALRLTEVTRLDEEGFEQRTVASLAPGSLWPGRRIHTLNRAGELEVIDGSAMSARFRRR